jgi:hypothetical protein
VVRAFGRNSAGDGTTLVLLDVRAYSPRSRTFEPDLGHVVLAKACDC